MTDRNSETSPVRAEPKHLKEPNPGKCPRPSGCKCTWTPLDHGWLQGKSDRCQICN